MIGLRKKLSKFLIAFMIFNIFTSFSYGDFVSIYEEKSSQNISQGVIHEKILRFTDQGWLGINVLKIDLQDRDTDMDILTSQKGISQKETLKEMAATDEFNDKIVAAINGDFYDTTNGATMGPIVKDGKLITNTINDPQFASFNLDNDDTPFLDYWTDSKTTLENKNKDYKLNIDFKNKPYLNGYADRVVLIDRDWGELSFGNSKHEDIVEMVIVDNEVRAIRENAEPVEIPENGFIIAGVASTKALILNSFSIGDRVSLHIDTTPNIEALKLSIGGGAIIIKDGRRVQDFSLKIPGRHPRTAVGITRDKKQLIFITIDGRTSSYVGATQEELADVLLGLGAYDAINMDGGGSTEMIIRDIGDKDFTIANTPSSGFERRIVNGLGVKNTSKVTSLESIIVETDDTNIFTNTSRDFIVKGYDKNYNPLDIDIEDIRWSASGVDGYFNDNTFYPSTSGKGEISASYKGKSASIDINVLSNPIKLEVTPTRIFVDTDSEVALSANAIDSDGYSAKINIKDLLWSIPEGLGEIVGSTFHSSDKSGNNIITATFNNLNAYIQVANGYEEVVLNDFETMNGEFLAYPNEVKGSYSLSSNSKEGLSSGKIGYDLSNTDASRAAYLVFNNNGISMEEKPEKIGMWVYGNRGNNHWLRGRVTDANGVAFNIDFSRDIDWSGWKFVEANIPRGAVAPLSLERIYVVEIDPMKKDTGYILLDNITGFYKTGFTKELPKDSDIFIDKRNAKAELEGNNSFKFVAHGRVDDTQPLISDLIISKLSDIDDNVNKSIFVNNISQELENRISKSPIIINNSYSIEKYKNSSFIKLDNSKGGIRATNYNQWIWLLDMVENIDSKNVFVLMPNAPSFNDKLEERLFLDTLGSLRDRGIDVWVLTGENTDELKVDVKEGIRFLSLKPYPSEGDLNDLKNLKYVEFTANDGYVTYEIKSMY